MRSILPRNKEVCRFYVVAHCFLIFFLLRVEFLKNTLLIPVLFLKCAGLLYKQMNPAATAQLSVLVQQTPHAST